MHPAGLEEDWYTC